jgi:gliding motility-associated-like protein
MKNFKLSIFLIFVFSTISFAQFSKTHYLPPLAGTANTGGQSEEQYIYISTPSITPINYKIIRLGSTPIVGVVSRDLPVEYNANGETQYFVPETNISSVMSNRGYIVEADDVVYVTLRTIAGGGNQAGELVSKGLAALGTHYRIGAMLNTGATNYSDLHLTFVSILATENNTIINFSDIKPGVSLVNNAGAGNTPASITLNAGQSYVLAVKGPLAANKDGLIGALVTSNKPIAVNCGSFLGNNGNLGNVDLGFDQIVSVERVEPIVGAGSDYIFIKSTGQDPVERPLLVIDQNNTDIFLNGSAIPSFTKNAGEYVALNGSNYGPSGNLFVHTSKPTFAFQSVGDNVLSSQANQELFFVPPLSCQTPHDISNIPFIERIGARSFTGRVTIITQTGSSLNFVLNGVPYTYAGLPGSITKTGPTAVIGNANYVTYVMTGFTGNVSASSTGELYLAAYGSDGAATFGGFYSGFTFKPEITLGSLLATQSSCIPNVELKVSTLTAYNAFQWYFNGNPIAGATGFNYFPTAPGYYKVSATITACGTTLVSDDIPVSECPTNLDGDLANDNVDLDNDNDGIKNCVESYGDVIPNLSNPLAGTISVGTYSNSFTGTITTGGAGIPVAIPFVGNATGSFVTEIPSGIGSFVKYQMNFTNPVSLSMQYAPATANPTDLIDSNEEFIVNSPLNKTITVLNPTNQLLIDTNFDGIYESNVTQFSGFEIRFRINGNVPIAAGTGTFSFRTYLSTSISITHKNLSNTLGNKATFSFTATCIPKDSDLDGIPDQLDVDSDNDGILDNTEFMSQVFIPRSNVDANANGVDDAYDVAIVASDFDGDTVPDYLDLDSDNDGIYDVFESGSGALDVDLNGMVDGLPASFGTNGLSNSLETAIDNGIINYTIANSDATGLNNYVDLDSDNDGCFDVTDAGFTDANNDNLIGDITPTINPINGLVTNATNGYTIPNPNYTIVAPIIITTNPISVVACELQNATFTVVPDATTPINGFQWQVSTNSGTTWTNLTNTVPYSGVLTANLLITNAPTTLNNYRYRVYLSRNGNSCGLYSNVLVPAILTINALPVVNPTTIVQCDDDTDGISDVNLTVKNNVISTNFATETFTYFTTLVGANTNDVSVKIATPTAYNTANTTVWARITNANGCYRVAQITVIVSATNINPATFQRNFTVCDDEIATISTDTDGISEFNFSSVTADILALLPTPTSLYTIKYYKNGADALAEINEITNISSYRNVVLNMQNVWARVDSNVNNACFGIGPFIKLTVEALPIANTIPNTFYKQCDDIATPDGIFTFNTSTLESLILNGQTNKTVTYFNAANLPLRDSNNVLVASPFPATFSSTSQTIRVRVTNNVTATNNGIPCFDETFITFTVDARPIANPVVIPYSCDDLASGSDTDGKSSFSTTGFQSTILGTQTGVTILYTFADGTTATSLPDPFVTSSQIVTVTVTNPANTACIATTTLNFVVKPYPNINLLGNDIVCINLPSNFVVLSGGISDGTSPNLYTYIWKKDGVLLPNITYTINVNTAGIYTVEVATLIPFACSRTRTITVIASDIATLLNPTIVDLTDTNTVLVNVTGAGNYEYSLDLIDGPFQDSNFFDNVSLGSHIIYINDKNGCGKVPQNIIVIGAPKYFTPNGDEFNDTWNVIGVNTAKNANSLIFIFDRFGKLLKQISPSGQGWDGTFNGEALPADDYWYTLDLQEGRSAKGHFALKR